jgi:hypothetical protein
LSSPFFDVPPLLQVFAHLSFATAGVGGIHTIEEGFY